VCARNREPNPANCYAYHSAVANLPALVKSNMSYVRNCESDVFISYAHFDNDSMFAEERGWIEVFHQALEVRLRQLLGEEPNVWRDPALSGNEYFTETIKAKLLKTALLLSIVTPRYVRSKSCLQEVEEFCRAAEQTGGIRFQDKARLLKVVKTEVARQEMPLPLQSLLGYEFYALDQAKRAREYRLPPNAADESYKACLDTLDDLAYDIKMTLQALRTIAPQDATAQPAKPQRVVYIADSISDLRPLSDQMRRELRQHGFVVFPCEASPENGARYREFVASQLQQSNLSVHLLGELYGTTLEGENRSTVEIQIEQAGVLAQTGALRRVLWLPEGLQPKEERQQRYIDTLQQHAADQPNTELLKTSIENLKTYLLRKLAEESKLQASARPVGAPLVIYLIHDQRDAQDIDPLRDALMTLGYEVKPSYFEGDETELREYHQENLVQCDATIIYYGRTSELWVQRKLYDLRKAFGLGRQRPFLAKAVFVGAPQKQEKERFRTQDAMVISALQGFPADTLAPFLRPLTSQP